MTFGSLFAGIGGLDLGLERAGMQCKWQVEINPYAQRVLTKHWPEVRRHDDIKTWPESDTESVDLICGGFPCQDISFAGKGAGLSGERSGLFYELIRVVREMGPRYVLLENVSALLVRGIDDVLGTLASIGVDAEWDCIPAAAVGAPHIRDRVFILAYADTNGSGQRCDNTENEKWRSSEDWRAVLSPRRNVAGADVKPAGEVSDANSQRLQKPESKPREERTEGRAEQWTCFTSKSWWATEPDVGRVAYGVPARVDRLRGLGNAVVPQVAEFIGNAIVEHERRHFS